MEPKQQLLINLANLLKVKTIITLVIIFSFCFKTLVGVEITSEYVMISTAVVTYYFTRENNLNNRDSRNFNDD